jgi:hypothetical protein
MANVDRHADGAQSGKAPEQSIGYQYLVVGHRMSELKSVQERLGIRVVVEDDERFIASSAESSDSLGYAQQFFF